MLPIHYGLLKRYERLQSHVCLDSTLEIHYAQLIETVHRHVNVSQLKCDPLPNYEGYKPMQLIKVILQLINASIKEIDCSKEFSVQQRALINQLEHRSRYKGFRNIGNMYKFYSVPHLKDVYKRFNQK